MSNRIWVHFLCSLVSKWLGHPRVDISVSTGTHDAMRSGARIYRPSLPRQQKTQQYDKTRESRWKHQIGAYGLLPADLSSSSGAGQEQAPGELRNTRCHRGAPDQPASGCGVPNSASFVRLLLHHHPGKREGIWLRQRKIFVSLLHRMPITLQGGIAPRTPQGGPAARFPGTVTEPPAPSSPFTARGTSAAQTCSPPGRFKGGLQHITYHSTAENQNWPFHFSHKGILYILINGFNYWQQVYYSAFPAVHPFPKSNKNLLEKPNPACLTVPKLPFLLMFTANLPLKCSNYIHFDKQACWIYI